MGGKPLYEVKIVSGMAGIGKLKGCASFRFKCHADFRTFCGEIDTLLVPGGLGVEERKPDPAAVQWLQKAATGARRVGSFVRGRFFWLSRTSMIWA